ncbi:MAG: hypothetical protein EHM58_04550 [Ignavibacteriae bacterium]|nr:MAG: hypothetical protein EHM58_04550 [Ignavibacteriota bacterium]
MKIFYLLLILFVVNLSSQTISTNPLYGFANNNSISTASRFGFDPAATSPVPLDYRTNLIVELFADSNVTTSLNAVDQWVDVVSGVIFRQSTAVNKPTLVANGINGRAYILFTGTEFLTTASAIDLTNFTIIITYKTDTLYLANRQYIIGGDGQGILGLAFNLHNFGEAGPGFNPVRTTEYTIDELNNWHIRALQNTQLFSNGVETSYNNTGNLTEIHLSKIGGRADNTVQNFFGKITNIRIYNAVLSSPNLLQAVTYLDYLYSIY